MDDAKQQLVDKLKTSNNILVTVSRSPSVDQLAACLGLALTLNKQGKHVAAVFSGNVPSTLEFLQPEETIEKNTDSLRDFIIALDKSKADKLRYKVEDNVVRIFITPYKTSISEEDLEFSQGDFNVDLVVALGVARQEDLDEAITAHGRILHDATVASINIGAGELGSINWQDPQASSLCEMTAELTQAIDSNLLDQQIATALLTGIVAETERFSNDKTSSHTMSMSATLMAAGANQQLVASKLEEPEQAVDHSLADDGEEKDDNGMIEIDHKDAAAEDGDAQPLELPAPTDDDLIDSPPEPEPTPPAESEPTGPETDLSHSSKLVTEPPVLGGELTANSRQEGLDPVTDPLSMPDAEAGQLLERKSDTAPMLNPVPTDWTAPAPTQDVPVPPVTTPPESESPAENSSLSQLEDTVKQNETPSADVDEVRDEVNRAHISNSPSAQEPIQALNAVPLGTDLHPPAAPATPQLDTPQADPAAPLSPNPTDQPIVSDQPVQTDNQPSVTDSNAPPPVPPPIPFQFGNPSQQQ